MGKEHRDEDVLRELYIEQDLTQAEVAEKLDVHTATIQNWRSRYGIEKEGTNPPIEKEKLQDLYWNQELSSFDIADKFEYSAASIRNWMEYYDIERRGPEGVLKPDFDKEEFERLYVEEGLGLRPIAEKLNSNRNTLKRWRDRWGIEPHNPGNSKFSDVDHTELVRLYVEEGLSQAEIARELDLDVGQTTVGRWLDRLKVNTQNKAGWGQLIESNRGETVKSKLEYRTANWLYKHNIDYEYEPDMERTDYVPDFQVGDKIIECWGVVDSDDYEERREEKVSEYESLGFDVISVWPVIGDRPTVSDVLPDVAWQMSTVN